MTVSSRDTRWTTGGSSMEKQHCTKPKVVPRAASGLPQLKAQTQSCPWKEVRASPQFTPPTSQPWSHTLYLTTSNRCVNPSLDLHHPRFITDSTGFGYKLCTHARLSGPKVSKACLLALTPAPSPADPKETQGHLLWNRSPTGAQSGVCAGRLEGRGGLPAGGELGSIYLSDGVLRLFLPAAQLVQGM